MKDKTRIAAHLRSNPHFFLVKIRRKIKISLEFITLLMNDHDMNHMILLKSLVDMNGFEV